VSLGALKGSRGFWVALPLVREEPSHELWVENTTLYYSRKFVVLWLFRLFDEDYLPVEYSFPYTKLVLLDCSKF